MTLQLQAWGCGTRHFVCATLGSSSCVSTAFPSSCPVWAYCLPFLCPSSSISPWFLSLSDLSVSLFFLCSPSPPFLCFFPPCCLSCFLTFCPWLFVFCVPHYISPCLCFSLVLTLSCLSPWCLSQAHTLLLPLLSKLELLHLYFQKYVPRCSAPNA